MALYQEESFTFPTKKEIHNDHNRGKKKKEQKKKVNSLHNIPRMRPKLLNQALPVPQLRIIYPMRKLHPPREVNVTQLPLRLHQRRSVVGVLLPVGLVVVRWLVVGRAREENVGKAEEEEQCDDGVSRVARRHY